MKLSTLEHASQRSHLTKVCRKVASARWHSVKQLTTKPEIISMTLTTNEEDQRRAAELTERLAHDSKTNLPSGNRANDYIRVPNVSIDEGAHKYVLITACLPGGDERQNFVVSRRGAEYHRNAAEPFIELLERNHYASIRITGGGRIALDNKIKKCSIYGYSYGFGLADHALSKAVVEADSRYSDYDVTWSNDGY